MVISSCWNDLSSKPKEGSVAGSQHNTTQHCDRMIHAYKSFFYDARWLHEFQFWQAPK